jgi:YHS domain-containing protein
MRRRAAAELVLAFSLLLAGQTLLREGANAQSQSKAPVFADFKSKLALDGHDPVAYFAAGKPTRGNPAHKASWNGATWYFASAENKAAFEANPRAFAPQYGGYCAWAVSEGYTAKGDPYAWRIVDGRLYVNYNASVQKDWEKNIPGRITKGDKNWPKVLDK